MDLSDLTNWTWVFQISVRECWALAGVAAAVGFLAATWWSRQADEE